MGSSGSGRIGDYPGSSPQAGSDDSGGSPMDRCGRAFNARLEDVEQSDYYRAHKTTPPIGTPVEVVRRKRLVAQTTIGESIGNMPTSFNYLAACLADGWRYVGTVRTANNGPPVATISADFAATSPR